MVTIDVNWRKLMSFYVKVTIERIPLYYFKQDSDKIKVFGLKRTKGVFVNNLSLKNHLAFFETITTIEAQLTIE